MMTTQKSSWLTKEAGEAQREWYVIDATGHTLGRLASRIALVLRGKHKATYTPNVDMGDFVIVLNPSKQATFKQLALIDGVSYLKPLNNRFKTRLLGDGMIIGVVREAIWRLR